MTAACGDKAGTLAGMSRHRRAWDPACDACKKAAADYQRRRRQSSPRSLLTPATNPPAATGPSSGSSAGIGASSPTCCPKRGAAAMTCKPHIFVHDDEYYAYCARCRWVSDTATNITVARVRADRHQQEGENA